MHQWRTVAYDPSNLGSLCDTEHLETQRAILRV